MVLNLGKLAGSYCRMLLKETVAFSLVPKNSTPYFEALSLSLDISLTVAGQKGCPFTFAKTSEPTRIFELVTVGGPGFSSTDPLASNKMKTSHDGFIDLYLDTRRWLLDVDRH